MAGGHGEKNLMLAGHQTNLLAAFAGRLRSFGWVEGRNLHVEQRWAAGDLAAMRIGGPHPERNSRSYCTFCFSSKKSNAVDPDCFCPGDRRDCSRRGQQLGETRGKYNRLYEL